MTTSLSSLQANLEIELRRTAPMAAEDQVQRQRLGPLDLGLLALMITSWGVAQYLGALSLPFN